MNSFFPKNSRSQQVTLFQNFKTLYGPLIDKESITIGPMLARPKSRGRVTLKSNNPFAHPVIDPNFLDNTDDIKTMIEGEDVGFICVINCFQTLVYRILFNR